MQFRSTKHYLSKLIKDGHKWQYLDINGFGVKPKFHFTRLQFVLLIIASFAGYQMKTGFSKDFISYIISALSILVGLFLTLMISVFDKFLGLNLPQIKERLLRDRGSLSDKDRTILLQKKNFFVQFTALTAYSILVSILCIILLSISLLWSDLSLDHSKYVFVGWKEINMENSKSFLLIVVVRAHRFATIYFLLDFIMIVLYAVSGIYNYFSIEYKRIKLTDDEEF